MKLSECLELSIAQKKKIEEILTKFISENDTETIVESLVQVIDSVIWSRTFEVKYTKDVDFLRHILLGIDSHYNVLSCISLYLLNDWSKEKPEDVLPDNDQSEIIDLINERIASLRRKEKENGSNI